MKITLFTSNQPRHLAMARKLAEIADEVWMIEECCTVFPGLIDDFYSNSAIMQKYFHEVQKSEKALFPEINFLPSNVKQLALKDGDLKYLSIDVLSAALKSDFYITFGCSFIKGDLADFLISRNAINIHMGISPYYRGNSCNFWALYDRNPEFVGATLLRLNKKLDDGEILCQVFPSPQKANGFDLGMLAVSAAQDALVHYIENASNTNWAFFPASNERYASRLTKRNDFSDFAVTEYLNNRIMTPDEIYSRCMKRDLSLFTNPVIC